MAYQKQHWSDDPADNTPISAARLNHMEDGIANIQTDLEVSDGSITTEKLANNAVTGVKINNNAVSSAKIADLAVSTGKLAGDAVTSTKIANGAVTQAKIGSSAVGTSQIANGAVSTAKIGDSQVSAAKLATNAVQNSAIANGAVTQNKMAASSVGTSQISNGSITTDKIQNNAVNTSKVNGTLAASGIYSGDAEWNREISLPFTPNYVSIVRLGSNERWEAFGGNATGTNQFYNNSIETIVEQITRGTAHANYFIRMQNGPSFRVNGQNWAPQINQPGGTYFWFAIGQ